MSEVTQLLDRISQGDCRAADALLPLVYGELRDRARAYMAGERAGHTLGATALVHEAFAKLAGGNGAGVPWRDSRHFFNAAAEVMRQLLVDHARRRRAEKRGGRLRRVDLAGIDIPQSTEEVDWEGLDRALTELKRQDGRRYQVVMLRYFAGLPEDEVARCLEVSERTVQRDWKVARRFLFALLQGEGVQPPE